MPVFKHGSTLPKPAGSNIAVVANGRHNRTFPLSAASVRRIDPKPLNRADGITSSADPGFTYEDSLNSIRSMHPSGGVFVFLGGQVEFMAKVVVASGYQAAGAIAGGEAVGPVNPYGGGAPADYAGKVVRYCGARAKEL